MPAQDLVHGFTAGSLGTLRTCLQGSGWILPSGRRFACKPEQDFSSQRWGPHLSSNHQASKSLTESACISYPVVTVWVVAKPNATPCKNQQDTAQLVPSLSGPVNSSPSPSSVPASVAVIRWNCGSLRNFGDMRNKNQVSTHRITES